MVGRLGVVLIHQPIRVRAQLRPPVDGRCTRVVEGVAGLVRTCVKGDVVPIGMQGRVHGLDEGDLCRGVRRRCWILRWVSAEVGFRVVQHRIDEDPVDARSRRQIGLYIRDPGLLVRRRADIRRIVAGIDLAHEELPGGVLEQPAVRGGLAVRDARAPLGVHDCAVEVDEAESRSLGDDRGRIARPGAPDQHRVVARVGDVRQVAAVHEDAVAGVAASRGRRRGCGSGGCGRRGCGRGSRMLAPVLSGGC